MFTCQVFITYLVNINICLHIFVFTDTYKSSGILYKFSTPLFIYSLSKYTKNHIRDMQR